MTPMSVVTKRGTFKIGQEVYIEGMMDDGDLCASEYEDVSDDLDWATPIQGIVRGFDSEDDSCLIEITCTEKPFNSWGSDQNDLEHYGVTLDTCCIWTHINNLMLHEPEEATILSCKHCPTTSEYAEPNQPDGSFICYSCRKMGRK